MSNHRGPKKKVLRRLFKAENNKKRSEYALRNNEKKKVIWLYGLKEKQLRNLFSKLIKTKDKSDIGYRLLLNCESRLDNLVFISGIVNTLAFARQLVSHRHILVNGKKNNIPSYKVKVGEVISLKDSMVQNKLIQSNLENNVKPPSFLSVDNKKITVTYLRYPNDEEISNKNIDTSLIVEWYSRKV